MTTASTEIWNQFATRIAAWDGSPESAGSLLRELRDSTPPPGDLKGDAATLRKLHKLHRVHSLDNAKPIDAQKIDASLYPGLRLLALDPAIAWPWADPVVCVRQLYSQPIAPAHAGNAYVVRWTDYLSWRLARVATAVCVIDSAAGRSAREWLWTSFQLRPREHWVPAAVALSGLVLAPGQAAEEISKLEARCAEVVPSKNRRSESHKPQASNALNEEALTEKRQSDRHDRVLGTLVAARLGSFAGEPLSKWVDVTDYDMITAMADGLLALAEESEPTLAATCRTHASRMLAVFVDERKKIHKSLTYQAWDATRALVSSSNGEVPEAVWRLLLEPTSFEPGDVERMAGNFFDAGLTLRWLKTLPPALAEAQTNRLLAGRLAAAPGVARAALFDLVQWNERLAAAASVLSPQRRKAVLPTTYAAALAEMVWLVELPDAATLDWPLVVAAIGADWIEPTAGIVSVAAWDDVFRVAVENGAAFAYIQHKRGAREHEGDGPLRIGGLCRVLRSRWRRDGERWEVRAPLTQHAANQIGRLLMSTESPDERARIVLRVISEDAPPHDARRLIHGVKEESLWTHVLQGLPSQDKHLRDALTPLAAAESRGPVALRDYMVAKDADLARVLKALSPQLDCSAIVKAAGDAALAAESALPRHMAARDDGIHGATGSLPVRSVLSPDSADGASPSEMKVWCKEHLIPLGRVMDDASRKIQRLTGPVCGPAQMGRALRAAGEGIQSLAEPEGTLRQLGKAVEAVGREIRRRAEVEDEPIASDLAVIMALAKVDAAPVGVPLLDPSTAAAWRSAMKALRRLADPLPAHTELAIDGVAASVERWISLAEANHRLRTDVLHELGEAITEGDEERLSAITETHRALLGHGALIRVGRFWLNRLSFAKARDLREKGVPVPSAAGYFSPLLLGVAGAPLSSIQTDKIWTPLLNSVAHNPLALSYHLTWSSLLAVCTYMLWADVRRMAPGLDRKTLLPRAIGPFALLAIMNFAINGFVLWIAPQGENNPAGPFPTLLLWSSLSLFMGIFLGLIAQGRSTVTES